MTLIQEIRSKVTKDDVIDFVSLWQLLHDYLLSLKEEDTITKDHCIQILSKFRNACGIVHEKVCRTVLEHEDGETRELDCPLYNLCTKSGNMLGHRLYCEIAGHARHIETDDIKLLLNDIPEDSLIDLKSIRNNW